LGALGLTSTSDAATAFAVAVVLTLATQPFGLVERVLIATRRGPAANVWTAITNAVAFAGMVLAFQLSTRLTVLALFVFLFTLLARGVSALFLVRGDWKLALPTRDALDTRQLRAPLQQGVSFLLLQIAALVLFQTDNLIIAAFLGAEAVTEYSVTFRLFGYVVLVQSLLLTPLWPAYAEAFEKGDVAWIKVTMKRLLIVSMPAFAIVIVLLVLFSSPILDRWTGSQVRPPLSLVILIAVWTLMALWGNNFSVLQNALGRIRLQAISSIAMALINLVLSLLLVRGYGSVGVITATIVSYGLLSFWIGPLDTYRMLKKEIKRSGS
jgi:O-antigen/teichoic acid export membrane protein